MSLIDADLALLRTSFLFDLSTAEGRRASVAALRTLFVSLHAFVKPDVVFEIGAREATFAQSVRDHLPDARIFAFEANPHNFARHSTNPRLTEQRVQYLHSAVSDQSGSISFFLQKRRGKKQISPYSGSNSVLHRLGDVDTEEIIVPSVRIDEFMEGGKITGSISTWIDVEGAIGMVLESLGDRMGDVAMIFCEVEEKEFWSGQWTWPIVHRFLTEGGFCAVARDFEFVHQHNVLFLRETLMDVWEVRNALALHYSAVSRGAAAG